MDWAMMRSFKSEKVKAFTVTECHEGWGNGHHDER